MSASQSERHTLTVLVDNEAGVSDAGKMMV